MSEDYNELFELWDKSAAENAEEFEQLDKELDEADIDQLLPILSKNSYSSGMKFSKALLMDSGRMGAHYFDLQVALYCAVWYRNEDSRHYTKASFGLCDYDPIITAIINYNRAFKKLLDIKEPLVAMPIIRIQMENLVYLFAESLYPNKILYKVYDNAKEFNQIAINGEKLKTADFILKLDEKYNGLREIWKRYCCYVHPSSKQDKLGYVNGNHKEVIDAGIEDMQLINQAITDTLQAMIDRLTVDIKARGEYKSYLEYVELESGRLPIQ